MAEPLDYFNPTRGGNPAARRARVTEVAAIPIEFDAMVTQTADHAAARAVEAELARRGIAFFRTEGPGRAERVVELHVRSADRDAAAQAAGMIFARRQRLNKLSPRPAPPPSEFMSDGSPFE